MDDCFRLLLAIGPFLPKPERPKLSRIAKGITRMANAKTAAEVSSCSSWVRGEGIGRDFPL